MILGFDNNGHDQREREISKASMVELEECQACCGAGFVEDPSNGAREDSPWLRCQACDGEGQIERET
jgi:DnaJ-class molecular chaperone